MACLQALLSNWHHRHSPTSMFVPPPAHTTPLVLPPAHTTPQGRIKFVNIASMAYDPAENEGILYEEAMEVGAALLLWNLWNTGHCWVFVRVLEGVLTSPPPALPTPPASAPPPLLPTPPPAPPPPLPHRPSTPSSGTALSSRAPRRSRRSTQRWAWAGPHSLETCPSSPR